jgi:hypothetical protein
MNLLGAALYDPATAVSKATTAAIAMTAIDTTNLRVAITVPSHGLIRVRLMACLHGATTYPSILLGVMNGATVVGRVAPVQSLGNTAVATALVNVEADFVVTGLTPGAMNLDAAYAVETLVASTGLKYGGPNNTTANDAFGAFVFEVWDPKPNPTNFGLTSIDANGRLDVIKVAGTTQTARDLGAQLDAAVSTRSSHSAADVWAVGTRALTDKAGFALSAAGVQAIWDALTSALTTANSIGKLLVDNINATISSRLPTSSYTAPDNTSIATILTRLGAPAGASLAADIAAAPTTLLDAAAGIETNRTLRQGLRLMLSVLLGKASGLATTTATFRDTNDTKDRVVATVDANGNRSALTLDAS